MYKNKFIDRIVNNIQFEWNFICILRTKGTQNSTVRFLKFTPKKRDIQEVWKVYH